MLNLRTGKNDLAPVALTRRDSIKGLAAILAAGCAPAIASAAARGAARMGGMRAAAAAAAYDYYDGVEYLESSGTQYIDTGVTPFGAMNCEIVAHYSSTSYGYYTIIGCRNGSVSRYTMRMNSNATGSTQFFQLSATVDASYSTFTGPTFAILRDGFHTIWKRGVSLGYDTTTCGTMSSTLTSSQFPYNHYMFALNNQGSAIDFSVGLCIASAKQYTDGETLRHFVPVVHEGEGKMLDLCHNKLYSNAGTGSFIVGPRTGVIQVPKQGFGANTPSI